MSTAAWPEPPAASPLCPIRLVGLSLSTWPRGGVQQGRQGHGQRVRNLRALLTHQCKRRRTGTATTALSAQILEAASRRPEGSLLAAKEFLGPRQAGRGGSGTAPGTPLAVPAGGSPCRQAIRALAWLGPDQTGTTAHLAGGAAERPGSTGAAWLRPRVSSSTPLLRYAHCPPGCQDQGSVSPLRVFTAVDGDVGF